MHLAVASDRCHFEAPDLGTKNGPSGFLSATVLTVGTVAVGTAPKGRKMAPDPVLAARVSQRIVSQT